MQCVCPAGGATTVLLACRNTARPHVFKGQCACGGCFFRGLDAFRRKKRTVLHVEQRDATVLDSGKGVRKLDLGVAEQRAVPSRSMRNKWGGRRACRGKQGIQPNLSADGNMASSAWRFSVSRVMRMPKPHSGSSTRRAGPPAEAKVDASDYLFLFPLNFKPRI